MRDAITLLSFFLFSSVSFAQNTLVEWSYASGAEVDYGLITKTATQNVYDNAGAVALNLLPSGEDGNVQFPLDLLNKQYCVGLIHANSETKFVLEDFEYAIELNTSNSIRLLNYGALIGTFGIARLGDVLGFSISRGEFFLLKNGHIVSSGYRMDNADYLLATAMKTTGARVQSLTCDFMNLFTVEWESSSGINVMNNGGLGKTSSGNSWGTAAAYSANIFLPYQDGKVFLKYGTVPGERAFGLISDSVGLSYLDIEYCAKFGSNTVEFYEYGRFLGSYGPLYPNDKVEIARIGAEIQYVVNGKSIVTRNTNQEKELKIQGALKLNPILLEPLVSSVAPLSRIALSYVRLYNSDDPEHIPFTRLAPLNDYAYFVYKELYKEAAPLNFQIFKDNNEEVTSSVYYSPSMVKFGDNTVRVYIAELASQRQYYIVVRDGQNRKWEMNFYKK